MKKKLTFSLLAVGAMFCLQSCPPDPEVTVENNIITDSFDFKATNLSFEDDNLYAHGVNNTTNINITINGVTIGSHISNQLPVRVGDEVEILFVPSNPKETEANFIMPDGTARTVTVDSPSFTWTVPSNFTPGMQIEGETRYQEDKTLHIEKGKIILIDLDI